MTSSTTSHIDDDLPPHDVASTVAAFASRPSTHPPRVLILYGSHREKSFSRYLAEECGRVLARFGADVRTFDPRGLPVFDRSSFDLLVEVLRAREPVERRPCSTVDPWASSSTSTVVT